MDIIYYVYELTALLFPVFTLIFFHIIYTINKERISKKLLYVIWTVITILHVIYYIHTYINASWGSIVAFAYSLIMGAIGLLMIIISFIVKLILKRRRNL